MRLWADGAARFGDRSKILAELGWTIPMNLTSGEMYELLADDQADSVDAKFIQLYESEDRREFVALVSGILERPTLERWHVLIKQTVTAYESEHFTITVPALLTVIEGVVMKAERPREKMRGVANRLTTEAAAQCREPFIHHMWRATVRFIERLFEHVEFDATRPELINRHWILHGRDVATWGQGDSLRLFQAVDTVSSLMARARQTDGEDAVSLL